MTTTDKKHSPFLILNSQFLIFNSQFSIK